MDPFFLSLHVSQTLNKRIGLFDKDRDKLECATGCPFVAIERVVSKCIISPFVYFYVYLIVSDICSSRLC